MSVLRVIFMGTPAFAVPALEKLNAVHDVIAVYSQPPRPAGRGYDLKKSAVHEAAEKMGLPVFTPETLKTEPEQRQFAAMEADIAVVAAYGLILPQIVLDAPKRGCINIHASLLPRWRGASPIQHSIWKGDKETGVTIMQMEQGLDTGPMLLKSAIPITSETTTPVLHDALSLQGGELIIEALQKLDLLHPERQDDTKSTYAPMLEKKMGRIEWTDSADEIDRQIRALAGWPGTYCTAGKKRMKILNAKLAAGSGAPGTVLNRAGIIACGKDALQLVTVQPDGGKPMDVTSAINGNILTVGEILS